ncbi:ABC transporter permease [Streptomyces radicis]|uniref:ABC transporter permease n=1 Tax=Streptomyces radicis TaxID=1750517 RepID=A0A3A9WRD3_9ACTN|nr:ABC transporter permease [Streptomyces radicis]RKN08697.1 ABC transporter permease [Streptomyces radicis]RKN21855.1 ABC transporter permease [Streptomyces radicis]
MFRTALRNVLAHKARLLMTTLAVLLGVAFVAGTLVFTATLSEAFQRSSEEGLTHVDLAIEPDEDSEAAESTPGGARNLGQDLLDDVAALPGVESAIGEVTGFAALADRDGDLVGDGFATNGANYAAGSDGTAEDERYPMAEGRAPERAGEIALDSTTAERTGYGVGDTARVSVDGPVREETVTGVFTTDDGNVAAGGTLVLFDTATAQDLFTAPGEYTRITVTAGDGVSQEELREAAAPLLPDDAEALTGERLAQDQADAIEAGTSGMRTALLAFAGIALFVGVFIIANTFTMLVAQRTRELALLRAVGASRRQVTRSVLIEALAVGLVAGATGLAAGVGIAVGLRSLMNALDLTVPDGPLIVSGSAVGVSLGVGVVVTVLAAYLPARRAAKIPPVAAMNSVHAPATARGLLVRNSIGALFAAGGAALTVAGIGSGDKGATMGAGAGLLVIGVFILTPLLSRPVIAATRPLLSVFGVSGKLARLNAVRNPRRTAATASALMIGLTLITGMTVIADSMSKAIERMASESLRSDYLVSMANFSPLSTEVEQTLAEQPDVTVITGLRSSPALVADDPDARTLTGADPAAFEQLTDLDFEDGSFEGFGGTGVLVDEATADDFGWAPGDTFTTTFEDGATRELTVAGVFSGNQLFTGVVLDSATLDPHMERVQSFEVLLKTEGGASEAAKSALEGVLGDNPAVLVQDKEDVSEDIAFVFTLLLNMLYALLAMAVIVAVLGVVNTLAMSVFERKQEIGMLRAIGLDRRATKRMVRLESIVIALFGGVLGVGLGVFFGWAVGELISDYLTTYEMVLPWARIGIFLGLAGLVGVLAALWPARRAARLNMLEAIKAE